MLSMVSQLLFHSPLSPLSPLSTTVPRWLLALRSASASFRRIRATRSPHRATAACADRSRRPSPLALSRVNAACRTGQDAPGLGKWGVGGKRARAGGGARVRGSEGRARVAQPTTPVRSEGRPSTSACTPRRRAPPRPPLRVRARPARVVCAAPAAPRRDQRDQARSHEIGRDRRDRTRLRGAPRPPPERGLPGPPPPGSATAAAPRRPPHPPPANTCERRRRRGRTASAGRAAATHGRHAAARRVAAAAPLAQRCAVEHVEPLPRLLALALAPRLACPAHAPLLVAQEPAAPEHRHDARPARRLCCRCRGLRLALVHRLCRAVPRLSPLPPPHRRSRPSRPPPSSSSRKSSSSYSPAP